MQIAFKSGFTRIVDFFYCCEVKFYSKPGFGVERIGEVNKIVRFFHRNVPQWKNFINKSVPDQRLEGLAINSRFSRSAMTKQLMC